MKILQIVCYFYPAWAYGGPPRNVFGLCQELVKRGHEVTVYTTDAFDAKSRMKIKQETVDGIEIRRFSNVSNYMAWNHRIFLTLGMIGAVRDNIKKYDIVHLNDYRTLQNLLAHHYARQKNVPYVVQARGSLVNVIAKQRLKILYDAIGGKKMLRDATRLIALAPVEIDYYKNLGADVKKIDIVPNGIDLAQFEDLPKRGSFRQKHRLNDKDLVVLFLGRLHKRKGVDRLISAFAAVSKDFPNARLVIAGPDDGHLPVLQKLTKELKLEDRVSFAGPLFGEEKIAAYTDADVFALTSSVEVFGVTILEAMSCGTPVIVADDCGLADVVRDKAGLVTANEPDSIKQALYTLLGDAKMRQRFGQNGRALIWQNYSWSNIARQMEQVYQKCLTDNKAGGK
jgi:glycosyltransferase involved in cell wall biosynthesis